MTCIVGVEHSGRVYLAGDLQGTDANFKATLTYPKVFLKNGVAFGYTVSFRFGQIIEHLMPDPIVPENEDDIYKWLVTTLVPSIKATLKANDYNEGGVCLIGVRGQLWDMRPDFCVFRSKDRFNACGSGHEYALGSLVTSMRKVSKHSAEECIAAMKRAVFVASKFCPSVGETSVVINT